jgi:NADP-dependent 3-hydroxy acid dehydrogenase YdfG
MALGTQDSALVTGASSSIGEATVRALRAEGVVVHAAA